MGVEVMDSNSSALMENVIEANKPLENGKVNIMFGSHSTDEQVKGEVTNLPKDVADEWPEPQQIHSFYFVKYRALEDPKTKAKLELAEKDLQKKNQDRLQFIDKLRTKRAERANIISQIRALTVENKQFRAYMDEKRKEMEPLQHALGKLRGSSGGRERALGICSSEEELNGLIKSLQYRIQHESIPLSEEKQILREIKALEGTREKVVANAAERARIMDSLGEKEVIQDQVKLIGVDLDGFRKEKQAVSSKLKVLDDEKLAVDKAIKTVEEELTALTEKRDKIFESIKDMRKQREDGNSPFHHNRSVLSKAKLLAANKDVAALKELSENEVDNFMSRWSNDKAFRDDYVIRVLPSLDMRQLSRDGRLRNPNEKPIVVVETESIKTSTKQLPKDDVVLKDVASEEKLPKAKTLKNSKEEIKKSEKIEPDGDEDEVFRIEKSVNDSRLKNEEVDEMKLKEMKRAEEKAKRILSEERKKKLAEKAAAKAAAKAQKEAEKKLKEREKRAKKKSGGFSTADPESEEQTDAINEVAEPETVLEPVETSVQHHSKDRREATFRNRARLRRSLDSRPKVLLKQKKDMNYLIWGIPAALVVLVLLVVGYNYLS